MSVSLNSRSLAAAGRKIVEDRALRPIVAMAFASEIAEQIAHLDEFGDIGLERGDLGKRDPLDFVAGALAVGP